MKSQNNNYLGITLILLFIGLNNNYAQSQNTDIKMTKKEIKHEEGLKQTIQNLIEVATTFDIEQLELIYHKNLQVIMIDQNGQKMISDKEAFKNLFETKLKNGDAPLNTWAEFNHIETDGDKGHVIVTRKVNLTGKEQKIVLSIDLVWEDNRWQVTREVIVTQPEN